jgi:hypothetical protein
MGSSRIIFLCESVAFVVVDIIIQDPKRGSLANSLAV